jgi:DNA-binding beta-propeller fold protein YncE
MRQPSFLLCLTFVLLPLAGCSAPPADQPDGAAAGEADNALARDWQSPQGLDDRVAIVSGFSGPEAVRYDPDQDIYFVSNFNGSGGDRDHNGFISRLGTDGVIESLHFISGGDDLALHAPRGMNISGDTLWVADVDGVHGFHRVTGTPLAFIDFTEHEPGFLNDIAVGPDGSLYVTDTGLSVVFRATGGEVSIAVELPEEGRPNGITWDPAGRFLTVPWGGGQTMFAFDPAGEAVEPWAESPGGNFDGIELVGDRALVASQADTSLHVIEDGVGRSYIRVGGSPADIAVDSRRSRVAVPYIALDRVDIWQLPQG